MVPLPFILFLLSIFRHKIEVRPSWTKNLGPIFGLLGVNWTQALFTQIYSSFPHKIEFRPSWSYCHLFFSCYLLLLTRFNSGLLGPIAILSNSFLFLVPPESNQRSILCGFLIQVHTYISCTYKSRIYLVYIS